MGQLELLQNVVAVLERLNVPYMIVGSYGSTIYGEPRFTNDIDIVAELTNSRVREFCAAFPTTEFYLSEAAIREAITRRFQFNLLHPATGNKVDVILPRGDEWGRTQLSRRRRLRLADDFNVYAASPEDVILGKLWYHAEGGSHKHLRDIASILKVSAGKLDLTFITHWADKLGYADVWQEILNQLDRNSTGSA